MPLTPNTLQVANGNPSSDQTMSSREIAELCEARHNDVVASIVRLFDQGVLRESRKTTRMVSPEGGGRPMQVYDLTKRDTLVVISGYNAELRGRIIDRWQALEAKAQSAMLALPQDFASALRALADSTDKLQALAIENAVLQPKAAALDRIALCDGSLCFTDAAKTLQIQPKTLFQFLDSHGWTYKRTGCRERIAYQSKLQSGLLEHKIETVPCGDGAEKTVTQARVTAKGLARLAKIFPPTMQAA